MHFPFFLSSETCFYKKGLTQISNSLLTITLLIRVSTPLAKLFIGEEPKQGGKPLLIGRGHVPVGWLTLFTIKDSITRQDEFPGKWLQEGEFKGEGADNLDLLLEYMQETVGFRNNVGEALANLQRFENQVSNHRYYNAYFKCLGVLEHHLQTAPPEAPVVTHFDELVSGPNDEGRIFRNALQSLVELGEAIAKGEGSDPGNIEQFKEIFRALQPQGTRVIPTGVLSSDFKRFRAKELLRTMLGEFTKESGKTFRDFGSFDLRYWTYDALTKEDTYLMFELSQSPGEKASYAIKKGMLARILDDLIDEFLSYLTFGEPEITLKSLSKPPEKTNLWAIRVMIPENNKFKPATILAPRDGSSWITRLTSEVNLPSVREDWNYVETVYFSSLRDTDKFKIVFLGARDMEEVKQGYVRWLRKARWRYNKAYGPEAFINMLGEHLLRVEDPQEGRKILEILTDVANLGFAQATEILTREDIVARIPYFLT